MSQPHIDIDFINEVFGGVTDEAKSMLAFFIQVTSPNIDALMSTPNTDFDTIKGWAHKAAGAAHTAGAKPLAEALNNIELSIMNSQFDTALTHRDTIPQLFQNLTEEIKRL